MGVGSLSTVSGLVMRGVEKRFGGVRALVDGAISAPRGEVHGILGENGAGKSTLIRILAGVISRDAGQVEMDSVPLTLGGPREALQHGIRTVYQESSLIPALTAEENMFFDRLPLGWHRRVRHRELRRQYDATIDMLEMRRIKPSMTVGDLSVADRQLLEVGKALASSPSVLILDEATSGLSLVDVEWVLRQARRLAEKGGVVLFVSHRIEELRSLANRLTVLRSGSTVFEAMTDACTVDELIEAMLGRRLAHLYPKRGGVVHYDNVLLNVEGMTVGNALGPISFQVHSGEILGVSALPEQGQRELLMGLAGDVHHAGRITLAGRPYSPRSPAEAQQCGVYMVPEDRQYEGLFLAHSVQANVTVSHLDQLRYRWLVIRRKAEQRAARLGAENVRLDPARLPYEISTLSGGNQQKAIFARALLEKPKVVLLFDATRGVDVGTKAEIFDLITSLADEGTAVVFYSTDFTEIVQMGDRVMVLYEGGIADVVPKGTADENLLLRLATGQIMSRPTEAAAADTVAAEAAGGLG
jgi:ABC-type sugar transport system ATPase subunit